MTDAESSRPTAQPRFKLVTHWQEPAGDIDTAVLAFWQREGALSADIKADERLRQVILHAETADGEVAGVCTAITMTLPRLGQPMYYYRCFIGKQWRKTRLVNTLLLGACEVLEAYARANDYPCIGVLLELENSRFGQTLQRPIWHATKFVYIGKSQRNLDLRVRYFAGARLKGPPKV
ncbi:MAG: hypothetical protein ABJB01_04770 [Rudaea sp.]